MHLYRRLSSFPSFSSSRVRPPVLSLAAVAVALLVAGAPARAASASSSPDASPGPSSAKDLVAAKLLSDVSAFRPGEPFTLGVLLEVKPGWHVYWQNPGDSGRPTRVKFSAPPGFAVGDLRFPVPEKFTQSDGAVTYGYTRSVLLTARVTPPKDARDLPPAGGKAALAADVSWLCCADLCVPGKARLDLNLEPSRTSGAGESTESAEPAASAERDLFAEWEKRLPVPLGEKGAPATGSAAAAPVPGGLALVASATLRWAKPPAAVEFFPAPEEAIKVSDVSVTEGAGETRVRCRVEPLKGETRTGQHLTTVVAARDEKGNWTGVRIDYPLERLGGR